MWSPALDLCSVQRWCLWMGQGGGYRGGYSSTTSDDYLRLPFNHRALSSRLLSFRSRFWWPLLSPSARSRTPFFLLTCECLPLYGHEAAKPPLCSIAGHNPALPSPFLSVSSFTLVNAILNASRLMLTLRNLRCGGRRSSFTVRL